MLRVPAGTLQLASPNPLRPYASRAGAPSSRRGEHGQSIVETTLSMLILLTMLFGILQASLAVYSYHFIAESAREGARYAIVRGSACTSFTSACPATAAQIQSYVTGLGYPGINTSTTTMTVTASWCAPTGSIPPACSAGTNAPGQIVRVAITYKFPLAVPFLSSETVAMNSTSQMVISQ